MVSVLFLIYATIGMGIMIWITSSEDFELEIQKAFPGGEMTVQSYFSLFVTYLFVVATWPYILYKAT